MAVCLGSVLHNKRSHHSEKPTHLKEEWPPLATTRESTGTALETQCNKDKKINKLYKKIMLTNTYNLFIFMVPMMMKYIRIKIIENHSKRKRKNVQG